MDTQLRVYFYQHVYVVGHDFQSDDFGTIFSATCLSTCSHRLALGPTRTARRYLVVHTQWYLLE